MSVTVTDRFTSTMTITDEGDAIRFDLLDVDGAVVSVSVSRHEARHLLATVQDRDILARAGDHETGVQLVRWVTSHADEAPAYRMVLWSTDLPAGEVLTFYPDRADFDLLSF